jgi:hypothetical protein
MRSSMVFRTLEKVEKGRQSQWCWLVVSFEIRGDVRTVDTPVGAAGFLLSPISSNDVSFLTACIVHALDPTGVRICLHKSVDGPFQYSDWENSGVD